MVDFCALTAIGAVMLLCLATIQSRRKAEKARMPLPPGPYAIPFLGNILSIDKYQPWITYTRWSKKYGELVYANLIGQAAVIINSSSLAHLLLDQRSRKYSDRPVFILAKAFGWDFSTVTMPYGEQWRHHRQIYHQEFHAEAITTYHHLFLRKTHQLLYNLLESPNEYHQHCETLATSVIMSITYGYTTVPGGDPYVTLINDAMRLIVQSASSERAALVAAIPILAHIPPWFPGADFMRGAKRSQKLSREMQDGPFDFSKTSLAAGVEVTCLVHNQMKRMEKGGILPEEETIIKEVSSTTFAGGVETTASTILVFLLAMTLNPLVQARAQAEIDTVVGSDRLPDLSDRSSLPYVEAVFRETLRWYPVVPLGTPHATMEDDVYEGYRIPKRTMVISNIWAMTHDETKYSDPESFDPSRFLTSEGQINDDSTILGFGFGRRICPGRHLAATMVWTVIVSVLAAFKIEKAMDDEGKEVEFVPEFLFGPSIRPSHFPCQIRPRSMEMEGLIRLSGLAETPLGE